jgi:arylformamidase
MVKEHKWIDISVTIKSGMVHWPGDAPVQIKRIHNIDKGDSNNLSAISMGAHTGTHIDAPLHFISNGKGIDRLSFDALIGKVRVLGIKDRDSISVNELKRYRIKRGERIIFKTSNSKLWKTNRFAKEFVYISNEAAKYMASLKIRTVGVDYLSVGGFHKNGSDVHKTLLKAGICIIEGLNLANIKQGNYDLICLPLKILNSDGAPARAVIRPLAKINRKGN